MQAISQETRANAAERTPLRWWDGQHSRGIVARWVIEGELVLLTAAHLGNGDGDDLTDMPLLVDPSDNRSPLLTGASLAGALRCYLREREAGYGAKTGTNSVLLFGGEKAAGDGEQSALIVDDAFGQNAGVELRHGVRLRPDSRTAEEKKLFDAQLWEAGTIFPIHVELLVRKAQSEAALLAALASTLCGLDDGSITLGARKRRGYGRVEVRGWRARRFDLLQPQGLLDWIAHGPAALEKQGVAALPDFAALQKTLGVSNSLPDRRARFEIAATFALDGSLLIRSGGGNDDQGPDMVHLRARQADGTVQPVQSGTSLGGALRARARKIARTLAQGDRSSADQLVNDLFGPEMEKQTEPHASRVSVEEHVVRRPANVRELVQNRISVDRFTGGVRHGALFNEQPVFGGNDVTLTLRLQLRQPEAHEAGLLLQLLKDLWTSDLALGGESGVGRGRLQGKLAHLKWQRDGGPEAWCIEQVGERLQIEGERATLDSYATALAAHLHGAAPQTDAGGKDGSQPAK